VLKRTEKPTVASEVGRSLNRLQELIHIATERFAPRAESNPNQNDYRDLAMQLSRINPGKGSTLFVTPNNQVAVAQCCATASSQLAAILRKPVLLVDISEEGRRLPNLLGLTSTMYCPTDEPSRYFSVSSRWYISTREGIPIGPYRSLSEAECGLHEFIAAPDWIKQAKADRADFDGVILPTYYKNLFFLPAAPARQALVRGAYLGKQPEYSSELISHLHSRFSHIVFYGGAVMENPLMLETTASVDIVLNAVVENFTRLADIDAALESLRGYRSDRIPHVLIRRSEPKNKVDFDR
jgi:hypothetical protein